MKEREKVWKNGWREEERKERDGEEKERRNRNNKEIRGKKDE